MISVALTAFANSVSRSRSIACRSADSHVGAESVGEGASSSSIIFSRKCLVSCSETACRISIHHCGSPSAFRTSFQKKQRNRYYLTQYLNYSVYNLTPNITKQHNMCYKARYYHLDGTIPRYIALHFTI